MSAEEPNVAVAGVVDPADGRLVPVGFYEVGPNETGEFHTLELEGAGEDLVLVPERVKDPRPQVKPRLFVKNKKYYIALVGKVSELLRAGFSPKKIVPTHGQGYFGRHEAYTIRSGPFPARKARREHIDHCVSPVPK
jgi:hypothetical protein